jgi:hypothetical protein
MEIFLFRAQQWIAHLLEQLLTLEANGLPEQLSTTLIPTTDHVHQVHAVGQWLLIHVFD